MIRPEILDMMLLPIGASVESRLIVWPLLATSVLWLTFRRFAGVSSALGASVAIWWIVVTLAGIAATLTISLFVLTPSGPHFQRVVLAFVGSSPLLAAGLVCVFLYPR